MNINDNDPLDLDPSEADLLAQPDEADFYVVPEPDDSEFDYDSNLRDDRYDSDGIPTWSAWS